MPNPRLTPLLSVPITLLLAAVPVLAADHWVAVQVDESGTAVEYYGQVSDADFAGATAGTTAKAFLKIDSVSWMDDDGKMHPLHESKADDDRTLKGYTDAMLLQVAKITRIVLVDKSTIGTAAAEPAEPKPAKPSTPRDQDM
jgi:hypothetical protein